MHYELYIDVFFLENFTMDLIILVMIRKVLKCSAAYGRIVLGAAAGAFLTCLIVSIPVPYAPVKFILFHCLPGIAMIKAGLGISGTREIIRTWVLLYVCGFLTGGVFQFLGQYVRTGSLFLVLAAVSFFMVSGIWSLLTYLARQSRYRCQVILMRGARSRRVQALIDTGNCLKDDITGKPVSIIDKKVIEELYGGKDIAGMGCMYAEKKRNGLRSRWRPSVRRI